MKEQRGGPGTFGLNLRGGDSARIMLKIFPQPGISPHQGVGTFQGLWGRGGMLFAL